SLIGGIDRPTGGRIFFKGKDISLFSEKELQEYRLNNIGFIHQSPERNLFLNISAEDNVKFPMQIRGGLPKKKRNQRADELLELVGLQKRKKQKVSSMSGGERQRVAVAVALANHPDLVLADEPTGELDTKNTENFIELIDDIKKSVSVTFIIATHDPVVVEKASKKLILRNGRIKVG
ncbi:MAG: ABC transporter ATP-binding protein, partial [Candidatus Hodarchaeales archaeon]